VLVWRICKSAYAKNAFSGDGGLKTPARWRHAGHRIVYTAQSLSLAALETWVHVAPDFPLPDHVQISAEIPAGLAVLNINEPELPLGWRIAEPASQVLRDIGTNWLASLTSPVARVPATTTPGEYNYLLNPVHPDFHKIHSGRPEPFNFDPRMWKQRSGI
jgi:RES domain-containing protein